MALEPVRAGLLGLYLKLYDDLLPEHRPAMDAFYSEIAEALRRHGIEVVTAPIVRVAPEIGGAVERFEREGAEAIVTLHLAYSPSLEAADALAATPLPLVALDTTPDYAFGFDDTAKLMANHGIHGVQDLTNLLLRRRKPFLLRAGHWEKGDVLARTAGALRAAAMARKMATARVGRVGGVFAGMGDFVPPEGALSITEVAFNDPGAPSEEDLRAETAADEKRFARGVFSDESHRRTLTESLRLRRWIERERLDAFTLCFPGIDRAGGWDTVPFLEASKAMARGVGYAGEGDTLTAAFHAAFSRVHGEVSFTEMFCPDWEGNRIFLSHMGEINVDLLERPALLHESDYRFSDTHPPVRASGCFKAGDVLFANLAPTAGGFALIAVAGTMESPGRASPAENQGWFRPASGSVAEVLENYSARGGTHHALLAYGMAPELLRDFAHLMGWEFHLLSR